MKKALLTTAIVVAVAGTIAAVAFASQNNSKQKGNLFYQALPFCAINAYLTPGVQTDSKFDLKFKDKTDTLTANVRVKNLTPDHVYYVRLIQGLGDCFTTDGTITTNRHGNGHVRFNEQAVTDTSVLFVCENAICLGANFWASKPKFLHEGPGLAKPTGDPNAVPTQ
jgi:hypothetical protein